MTDLIETVRVSPKSPMNKNNNGVRARAARQSKIAELVRIFSVRNSGVGLGRRELKDVLTKDRTRGGNTHERSSGHVNHHFSGKAADYGILGL